MTVVFNRNVPLAGLALCMALALFSASGAPASAQTAPAGQVIVKEGAVFLIRDGDERTISLGAAVFQNDRVRTGRNGKLAIGFSDGATIRLGPASEIAIADYSDASTGGARLLDLVSGAIRAVVPQGAPKRSFVVRTRIATAAARSTAWIVTAEPERVQVFVEEGQVTAAGQRLVRTDRPEVVDLGPAFGTTIVLGESPTTPAKWKAERISRVYRRLGAQRDARP